MSQPRSLRTPVYAALALTTGLTLATAFNDSTGTEAVTNLRGTSNASAMLATAAMAGYSVIRKTY